MNKYVAYAGSYTHESSKGIQIFDMDVEKGRITKRREIEIDNPSYVAFSHNGKCLYSICDQGVAAYNILPGETITSKYFTVTNKGNETIEDYVVVLEDVINNFYLREDLTYKLTCSSVDKDTLVKTGTCKGSSGAFPRDEEVIVTNDIGAGIMHKYYLTVTFNETYLDQSIDMNKTLKARVNIYDRDL